MRLPAQSRPIVHRSRENLDIGTDVCEKIVLAPGSGHHVRLKAAILAGALREVPGRGGFRLGKVREDVNIAVVAHRASCSRAEQQEPAAMRAGILGQYRTQIVHRALSPLGLRSLPLGQGHDPHSGDFTRMDAAWADCRPIAAGLSDLLGQGGRRRRTSSRGRCLWAAPESF